MNYSLVRKESYARESSGTGRYLSGEERVIDFVKMMLRGLHSKKFLVGEKRTRGAKRREMQVIKLREDWIASRKVLTEAD